MSFFPITREISRVECPEALADLERQHRAHTGKKRSFDEYHLGYSVSVQINGGCSFQEMLDSISRPRHPEPSMEERIQDEISRTHVYLTASLGRSHIHTPVRPVPQTVVSKIREGAQRDYEERARVSRMSPEQRDREIQEALRQLRGSPGFVEMNIPVRRRRRNGWQIDQ